MALTTVAPDEVATIVTTLEMTRRPPARPLPESRLRLVRWEAPPPDKYRALFARVGAPWLWFSRLVMDEAALTAILHDPAVHVFAVTDPRGLEVGMLELDFRAAGTCELAYVGLIPELTGQGHGRWLMAQALTMAWSGGGSAGARGVERVWVHTCTLDHPTALGFYRASGFTAISRTIETFPDPRITGILPADTAPQIPSFGASRR